MSEAEYDVVTTGLRFPDRRNQTLPGAGRAGRRQS